MMIESAILPMLRTLLRILATVLPFGIASAVEEAKTLGNTSVTEASFGLVILIGAWIFFITASPFRKKESSLKSEWSLRPDESDLKPDADTWNCDLPPSDQNAGEKADRWVLR